VPTSINEFQSEALEKFFRKQGRVLKKATQRSTGKAHPAERVGVPEKVAQERRARHRQQVSLHKRIWKLYREDIAKSRLPTQLESVRALSTVLLNKKHLHLRDDALALLLLLTLTFLPGFTMEPGMP